MSDLISRQAVLDYPIRLDHYDEEHGNRHFVLGIESVMEYVEHLPSADAVKVVRCKDCQHVNECHKSIHYTRNEPNTVTIGYLPIEWCSRGERREE